MRCNDQQSSLGSKRVVHHLSSTSSAPDAKTGALNGLCRQLDQLMEWVGKQRLACIDAPLKRYIDALAQVREQDLEPRAEGGVQIRQGVPGAPRPALMLLAISSGTSAC